MSRQRYSDELLIAAGKEVAEKYGYLSLPLYSKIKDYPTPSTIIKRFGSWRVFKDLVGVQQRPPFQGRKYEGKEVVAEKLKETLLALGFLPTANLYHKIRFSPSSKTIFTYFATWEKAVEAAGFHCFKGRRKKFRLIPLDQPYRNCIVCDTEFVVIADENTCSDECQGAITLRKQQQQEILDKRRAKKQPKPKKKREAKVPTQRICLVCSTQFRVGRGQGRSLGCSPEHQKEIRLQKAREYQREYLRRYRAKFKPSKVAHSPNSRTVYLRERENRRRVERLKAGLCPQCGGEWIEPIETHRGKPKHCRHCQEYYSRLYKERKAKRSID